MAKSAHVARMRWRLRALSAVLVVVGLTVAGAAIGLVAKGPIGALVGVIPGAVAGIVAGFVPGLRDRADAHKADITTARQAWKAVGEPEQPDGDRSPAALLRPDLGVVEFTGRVAELEELQSWCASDAARSVRVLTGPGGVGKTRLALRIAGEWAAARHEWRLVASGQESEAVQAARGVTSGRVLLVVDYAETRADLPTLLQALLADPGPMRVLMLARSLGEWWERLAEQSAPAVARLLGEAALIQLSPLLTSDKSDAALAEAALPFFADALKVPPPAHVVFELPVGPVPVLVLHAAALVAVLRFAAGGPELDPVVVTSEVLDELLEHEARYWRRTATAAGLASDGRILKPVVTAAALLGASSLDEAADLVGRVPDLTGAALGERRRWARWLYDLYPAGVDGLLGPLQPDLLAEAHVVLQLSKDPALARGCLRGLPDRQAERAMTVLAQAWAHHQEAQNLLTAALRDDLGCLAVPAARASIQTRAELGDVLADALADAPAPPGVLADIAEALPYPSVVLAQANVAITLRVRQALPPESGPQTKARWADRAGMMLAAAGRPKDALPAHQEAVSIYRELAAANPGSYRPDLARALDHLGVSLWALGRPEEALPVAQEAVDANRDLADANPDSYRPDLAQALDNLGVLFSELGRPAEALPVTQEAVAILRDLAPGGMSPQRPGLARALDNLGVRFSELGMPKEALPATQEAVMVFGELSEASPDSYRPDLARALDNLGVRFSELGIPKEALPATQEAVMVFGELSEASPDSYRPDLAQALDNLGVRFSELEMPEEALEAAQKAVAIHRDLAAGNPDRYFPDLASSLDSLGFRFWSLGRARDALPVAQEAIGIYRKLAAASPDRHRVGLARALSHLGIWLWALRQPTEALPVTQDATNIRRELTASNPTLYRPELAESLSNLGLIYRDLARPVEALPFMQEAVTAYKELASADHGRYSPNLAIAQENLADALSSIGGH